MTCPIMKLKISGKKFGEKMIPGLTALSIHPNPKKNALCGLFDSGPHRTPRRPLDLPWNFEKKTFKCLKNLKKMTQKPLKGEWFNLKKNSLSGKPVFPPPLFLMWHGWRSITPPQFKRPDGQIQTKSSARFFISEQKSGLFLEENACIASSVSRVDCLHQNKKLVDSECLLALVRVSFKFSS